MRGVGTPPPTVGGRTPLKMGLIVIPQKSVMHQKIDKGAIVMHLLFHGVFPALLTPFDAAGAVNYDALRELVRWNLDKGVNGFYVCGSTSEAFLLSNDERKKIVETVCAEVAGKAAVIAHVGCIGQDMAVELARHAEEAGADAISSVPPFYYGFSFAEIKNYYFALADTGLPVVLYNFVPAGGARLTAAQFMEFLSDPRFLGVKHTSSDFFLLERLKAFRPDAVIFNGFDEMFLSGLAAGADGGIGSTYNFMAEKYIAIEQAFRAGDIAAAQAEQKKANAIIQVLLEYGVMPGAKALCRHLGLDLGNCRKPFRTLTEEQAAHLIAVYEENR